MTRVMLTGATGFIGRQALDALSHAGHEVHAVARRRGPATAGVIWHEADLLESSHVVGQAEPRVLVHLAWYSEHGRYWTSPENERWVEASLVLLREFADFGGKRALLVGTCAEYEWSRAVYREDAPLRPATTYGQAKHRLHDAASAYAQRTGLELAWGRLFYLYGPYEAPQRFVATIARKLLAGEEAPMTAGTQVRDYLHVADAGAALAALADSRVCGPVNIASGKGVALRELAGLIAAAAGGAGRLRVGALPSRPDEPASLVADTRRLREEVGFEPRISLAQGVAGTVEWWRSA
jgi:nucleoside-diphosphate-sugar epimerase